VRVYTYGLGYSLFTKNVQKVSANYKIDIELNQLSTEIYNIIHVENGFAPIRLVDKYNKGGAILDIRHRCYEICVILKDGGEFVAYCDIEPEATSENLLEKHGKYDIIKYKKERL